MTYFPVENPYHIFTETDGTPLENGYIYIGEANLNPITNPITVYWDSAGLYPAAQPIRTVNGYPSRNGAAAKIYVNAGAYEDYSLLIKNRHYRTVFYTRSTQFGTGAFSNSVDTIADLRDISGYGQPLYVRGHTTVGDGGQNIFEWIDGAAPGTYIDDDGITIVPTGADGSGAWKRKYKHGLIDIRDFGAKGGTNDDTAAFQAAVDALPSIGGCIIIPNIPGTSNQYTITDTITISKSAVFFCGDRPGNLDSIRIRYDGSLDASKSMFYCTVTAHGFSMHNLYLDANDKAGFCLYQFGQHSPTLLTRPGDFQNLNFRGYIEAAWVIGDHTDTLNSAQFQVINARNIFLSGGANSASADGIHLNAQNCEFLNIEGIYIDPDSGNLRHHRNHIRQISGGLNIKGMVSTRAGTTALTADYAIYSRDQINIQGWRTEDRKLLYCAAVGADAPCVISGIEQRSVAATGGTSGTDEVILINHILSIMSIIGARIQGSISIGATSERNILAQQIYFDNGNAAGTNGSFIFYGPQNQRGLYHNATTGVIKLRGTDPEIDFLDETGNSLYRLYNGNVITPRITLDQITGDQAAFDIGDGFYYRISSDAARSIFGIADFVNGRMIKMCNTGSFNITFAHDSASASTNQHRIYSTTLANIVLAPAEIIDLIWEVTVGRWRAYKN